MRTALVVLCRKQQAYAGLIARGIASQTVRPDRVLVVMDRPEGNEAGETRKAYSAVDGCTFLEVEYPPVPLRRPRMRRGIPPFCAGYCRDRALDALGDDYGIAVFIDGDCIPQARLVESHVVAAVPGCITIGRRREDRWNGMDQRQAYKSRPIDIFGDTPRVVDSERYVADSGVVWTCNTGFTPGAVSALRELNRRLYGVDAVFHPDFCGRWGGEDGFLGMECLYGGIPMRTCPVIDDDGVVHIDHPRPDGYYDHGEFLPFLDSKRRELMALLGIAGRFRSPNDIVGIRE